LLTSARTPGDRSARLRRGNHTYILYCSPRPPIVISSPFLFRHLFIYFHLRCCVRPPEKCHYTHVHHSYTGAYTRFTSHYGPAEAYAHPAPTPLYRTSSTTPNPCAVGPAKISSTETKYRYVYTRGGGGQVRRVGYYGSAFN